MDDKEKHYEDFLSEFFKKADSEGVDRFINDTTGMDEESIAIYEVAKNTLVKIQEKYNDLQESKENGLTTEDWLDAEISIATKKICKTEDEAKSFKSIIADFLEKINIKKVVDDIIDSNKTQRPSNDAKAAVESKTEESQTIKNGGSY